MRVTASILMPEAFCKMKFMLHSCGLIKGSDVFLGLSAGNLLTGEMLLSMNSNPIVFACANPLPEIDPDYAKSVREDVILATGRSDFPNQINNVCAFPYIFRGALDCRAR